MVSKDLMRSLSLRLDLVRAEFRLRLYNWSLGIIEKQILDNSSLFWNVPSRVSRNLRELLSADVDDRLRFFFVSHAYSYRLVLPGLQQPIPSNEEVMAVMRRCVAPPQLDVTQNGFLPLSTPVSRLNRRKLHSATKSILAPILEERTDPADPGEWLYETCIGQWRVVARISVSSSDFQVDPNFDVRLGMGDLHLDRQLSLHRAVGIGPSAWDLCEPGDEEAVAQLIGEYCQFMVTSLAGLLVDLDAGISSEEVQQAEDDWKQWLNEIRAKRGKPPLL
jgi:hypothetical protein